MGLNEPQSLLSLHTFFEIRWISNFNVDVQWTVWLLTLSWKIREFLANQTALESHKGKGPMTLQIFIFRPQFETVFKGIFLPGPSPSSKSQWFVLNFLCQWTMNQEVPCLFCFIAQNTPSRSLPGPSLQGVPSQKFPCQCWSEEQFCFELRFYLPYTPLLDRVTLIYLWEHGSMTKLDCVSSWTWVLWPD